MHVPQPHRVPHTSPLFATCANHRTLARLYLKPQSPGWYQKQKGGHKARPYDFAVDFQL
jgi:hypothetical protein